MLEMDGNIVRIEKETDEKINTRIEEAIQRSEVKTKITFEKQLTDFEQKIADNSEQMEKKLQKIVEDQRKSIEKLGEEADKRRFDSKDYDRKESWEYSPTKKAETNKIYTEDEKETEPQKVTKEKTKDLPELIIFTEKLVLLVSLC